MSKRRMAFEMIFSYECLKIFLRNLEQTCKRHKCVCRTQQTFKWDRAIAINLFEELEASTSFCQIRILLFNVKPLTLMTLYFICYPIPIKISVILTLPPLVKGRRSLQLRETRRCWNMAIVKERSWWQAGQLTHLLASSFWNTRKCSEENCT